MKSSEYYSEIRPLNWEREEKIRFEKAEKKKAAVEAKAARASAKAATVD
jgi:hypothetical protein